MLALIIIVVLVLWIFVSCIKIRYLSYALQIVDLTGHDGLPAFSSCRW